MKKAPIPADDEQRLEALRAYEVLDTGPEVDFDQVVQLAAAVCDCPISLISLVDSDRQWFKAILGLDVPETPRDISFCGHAIMGEDLFEIPNATEDHRFHDNPLVVAENGIRFYAGQPLINDHGYRLGTLCVIDSEAKQLSSVQKQALETLAHQVVNMLELKKANKVLRESVEKLNEQALVLHEQKEKGILNAKLASLGVVAAGIAHEINSPLSVIQIHALQLGQLTSTKDIPAEKVTPISNGISETVSRISQIVASMKAIARGTQNDEFDPVCVKDVVHSALNLVKDRMRKREIALEVEGNIEHQLECRPGEISQIVVNLLSNSMDAIENSEQKWIRVEVDADEDYLSIRVVDSGPGVSPGLEDQILEPFFTTKEVGKGTGLGLSLCATIASQHHGHFCYLKNSENTTFELKLPRFHSDRQLLGVV